MPGYGLSEDAVWSCIRGRIEVEFQAQLQQVYRRVDERFDELKRYLAEELERTSTKAPIVQEPQPVQSHDTGGIPFWERVDKIAPLWHHGTTPPRAPQKN